MSLLQLSRVGRACFKFTITFRVIKTKRIKNTYLYRSIPYSCKPVVNSGLTHAPSGPWPRAACLVLRNTRGLFVCNYSLFIQHLRTSLICSFILLILTDCMTKNKNYYVIIGWTFIRRFTPFFLFFTSSIRVVEYIFVVVCNLINM